LPVWVGHGRLREWVGQCIALGRLNNRGAWRSLPRLGRTRQAVDIDPRGTGPFQQARQSLGGGAGGEYIIDDRQMLSVQDLSLGQREGLAQVAAAGRGVQLLLGGCVLDALRQVVANRNLQDRAQPVRQHPRLVEATLTQPPARQGHRQQSFGAWQAFIESVLQMARQVLGEQSPEWPARLMLETGDQTVHRKGEAPRDGDVIESRRMLEALAADRAGHRQWQSADAALTAEPGQLRFAART